MKIIQSLALILICLFTFDLLSCSDGWISLFDGKSMAGWTAVENTESWKLQDGALVANGPRSHLFYTGAVNGGNFKNFEFSAEVKTMTASNSGIFFHTEFQERGWPNKGYEAQVLNTHPKVEPGKYMERKMTGSIYAVSNVWKSPVPDNEWFQYLIRVQGKTMQTFINGNLIAEYTESDDPVIVDMLGEQRRGRGTFALQAHDPKSTVYYKNIKVKLLPDDLETPGEPIENAEVGRKLMTAGKKNIPLMDLHVHLKGGLTTDQALANARKYGLTYGIAVNCGLKMGIETEDALQAFLTNYKRPPGTYLAMQAEGREWLNLFSEETRAEFDYVFTDAMTWTNKKGNRMRLWIKEETEVGDPQDFMDQLVDAIEKILKEPIDIYVNPTYLPDEIAGQYDALWTPERMDRVIKALIENNVALEINDRRRIPSATFLKRAKNAGVKFTFGTNNGGANDLGHLAYCLDMIEECDLKPDDIWQPELKEQIE
jgi:hypothetical protein